MGYREASSSLVARSRFRKSPKAMKKALGLFSYAGRTFSSPSRQDRFAGSWREPWALGHPVWMSCFFRYEGRTHYRTPSRHYVLRLSPKAAKRGASSKAARFIRRRRRLRCFPPTREARFEFEVRQGSRKWTQAICGMPGSEFEPRCRKDPCCLARVLSVLLYDLM